ncbi:MAG: hypothetical protein HRU20_18730 [Pseudomonadales bacterium]|nr:hypothetical protein [Pseudomonadales bacterium]
MLALACTYFGEKPRVEYLLAEIEDLRADYCVHSQVDLSALLIVIQRIEAAVDLQQQVLAIEADHALALARLGYCRLLQEGERLLKFTQQSLDINLVQLTVYCNLVQIFLRKFQFKRAESALECGRAAN